eukprot:gene20396-27168_t
MAVMLLAVVNQIHKSPQTSVAVVKEHQIRIRYCGPKSYSSNAGQTHPYSTAATRLNTEMMLSTLNLDTYFEHVVLGDECTRPKPFPDPYLRGLELINVEAGLALVFEDSPSGTRAAVAAGIPVIGLSTGQDPETLLEAGASIVLTDFTAVMELVHAAAQGSKL